MPQRCREWLASQRFCAVAVPGVVGVCKHKYSCEQRGVQRCVQTALTTSVRRSHTISIQVAHGSVHKHIALLTIRGGPSCPRTIRRHRRSHPAGRGHTAGSYACTCEREKIVGHVRRVTVTGGGGGVSCWLNKSEMNDTRVQPFWITPMSSFGVCIDE